MATSTFDRKIEIRTPESLEKLVSVMMQEPLTSPLSDSPYSEVERTRCNEILKNFIIRSREGSEQ